MRASSGRQSNRRERCPRRRHEAGRPEILCRNGLTIPSFGESPSTVQGDAPTPTEDLWIRPRRGAADAGERRGRLRNRLARLRTAGSSFDSAVARRNDRAQPGGQGRLKASIRSQSVACRRTLSRCPLAGHIQRARCRRWPKQSRSGQGVRPFTSPCSTSSGCVSGRSLRGPRMASRGGREWPLALCLHASAWRARFHIRGLRQWPRCIRHVVELCAFSERFTTTGDRREQDAPRALAANRLHNG